MSEKPINEDELVRLKIGIPKKIHEILKYHKERTGQTISGIIKEALYRYLIKKKIIKIKTVTVYVNTKNKRGKQIMETMSEENKYCNSDSCSTNFYDPFKEGCK